MSELSVQVSEMLSVPAAVAFRLDGALGIGSGAGSLEAAICVQALREGIIPPTINLDTPDPACDLDYVPHRSRQADLQIVLSNSFGFGGHNATLALKAFR